MVVIESVKKQNKVDLANRRERTLEFIGSYMQWGKGGKQRVK